MKHLRSKFSVLLAVVLFGQLSVFSQDLRRKAEENPLSTVFYLLSTTEKDSNEEEKACLAKSLARADRFGEIEAAAKMIEAGSYAEDKFIGLINELIVVNKIDEASKIASFLIGRAGNDGYFLQQFFKPLIILKRDNDAKQIINKLEDSDKIDANFALAKIYLQLHQSDKALEVIENTVNLVEKSEYDEDRAILGFYYAQLNKPSEAVKFSQEAMKNLVWKTGTPEYAEQRILDQVVDTYRVLGKTGEANEILVKQGKTAEFPEPESSIETVESYLKKGNREKAIELLERSLDRLNAKEYGDSFGLGNLIEIYLKLGEPEKAEKIAGSLSGNEYIQQEKLLHIADFYIRKKNHTKASEILNFALEQTKKIDISEPEKGNLWTSNKMNQARYQSQIALRFMDMRSNKKALEIISRLKKPYVRALTLTEFVAVNKKRIPAAQLSPYLEEALNLLRRKQIDIFDSKKFDVYAIAARNFAEIGMTERANEVFAETLSTLSKEMIESGSDAGLLFAMCNIGVDFEKSKIEPNEKLKESLRQIIKNWENDAY